jgi:hypothetical protein
MEEIAPKTFQEIKLYLIRNRLPFHDSEIDVRSKRIKIIEWMVKTITIMCFNCIRYVGVKLRKNGLRQCDSCLIKYMVNGAIIKAHEIDNGALSHDPHREEIMKLFSRFQNPKSRLAEKTNKNIKLLHWILKQYTKKQQKKGVDQGYETDEDDDSDSDYSDDEKELEPEAKNVLADEYDPVAEQDVEEDDDPDILEENGYHDSENDDDPEDAQDDGEWKEGKECEDESSDDSDDDKKDNDDKEESSDDSDDDKKEKDDKDELSDELDEKHNIPHKESKLTTDSSDADDEESPRRPVTRKRSKLVLSDDDEPINKKQKR